MTRSPFAKQIENRNFLSPVGFKFSLGKTPKADFFCTSARIPELSLQTATQPGYLKDIDVPGEKLSFGDLTLRFLVDEDMVNYMSIHNWLTGLGFPKDTSQFRALQNAGSDRYPTTTDTGLNSELGRIKKPTQDDGGLYSDATLFVLSSKNNANLEIRFRDIYPIWARFVRFKG